MAKENDVHGAIDTFNKHMKREHKKNKKKEDDPPVPDTLRLHTCQHCIQ